MALRLTIGFFVSIALWWGIIHYMNIPKDRFLPPAVSINEMSQKALGYYVKAIESPYADHWWMGSTDTLWYAEYKFQPYFSVTQPDGKQKLIQQSQWYTGRIPIGRTEYEKFVPGVPVEISYDPFNPLLSGVSGTGKINIGASYFSGWLLYVLGFIATTVLVGELCKKWIEHDAI
ncbi:MAG TPA: hypothetical protein VGK19_15065 [Capsulimonadaceae bacterium]|jgi:hypothetical protein